MPVVRSRSDRQLLIFTGVFLAIAGGLFAAVLFLATGGTASPGRNAPVYLGPEDVLIADIEEGGPRYQANQFGGGGFWLDLEGTELVAYAVDLPGPGQCSVKWKDQRSSYVDCRGAAVTPDELDRYEIRVGRRGDSPANAVHVDLRRLIPAG